MKPKSRRLLAESRDTWLTWAARFGYAACGVVYALIGFAAIAAASGLASKPSGSQGILSFLVSLPLGPLMLAALGIGLAGYATLNFVGAINDPEQRGLSAWAILSRLVDVLTGALYVALAIGALAMVIDPQRRASEVAVEWARSIMGWRAGTAILAMAGFALMLSGAYLFLRAARAPFGEMLDRRSLSLRARKTIAIAARGGTMARGLIFLVCGIFVIRAADQNDADRIGDVGDALSTIGSTAAGPILLGLVGCGFVAYGGYQVAKARYQRIKTADSNR